MAFASDAPAGHRVVLTRVPVAANTEHPDRDLPDGSHVAACRLSDGSADCINLTADFASAGRPDISFDGTRILFVGKPGAGDNFSVWEMSIDGGNRRRVVELPGCNIVQAIYLSTLYTLDAESPAPVIAFVAQGPFGVVGRGVLHRCQLDGTNIRRIGFSPLGESDPCILRDGRLVFCPGSQRGESRLLSLFPDGTDVARFQTALPRDWLFQPCQAADGSVCCVWASPDGDSAVVAAPNTRSTSRLRLIAQFPDRLLRTPAPLDDGHLLVSVQDRQGGTFDACVLDLASGSIAPRVTSDSWHEMDAHVIAPRAVPAGRSSVVDDRRTTGHLYCLNSNLSDSRSGPSLQSAGRRIRVSTADPAPFLAAYPYVGRLLGDAPIESDGSFFLEVPASTPLQLQTLDADGKVLQTCAWIWVIPRENRGCIGCHEDPELTPPNLRVAALRQAPHVIAAGAPVGNAP